MKKIKIIAMLLCLGFGSLFARDYVYQITTPVDIDPIPGNIVLKDGKTYHIRYYIFHFFISDGNRNVIEYIERRVIPVSDTGLNATLVSKKRFDHKIANGVKMTAYLSLCEDMHGNSCVMLPSSMIETALYRDGVYFSQAE